MAAHYGPIGSHPLTILFERTGIMMTKQIARFAVATIVAVVLSVGLARVTDAEDGDLPPGAMVCVYRTQIPNQTGFATATLKFENTYVNGKLTLHDVNTGAQLATVHGTTPFALGPVTAEADYHVMSACLTNRYSYRATYQLNFNVG